MLKQLQERGTSLSGYKAPPPPHPAPSTRFFVGEQRNSIYLEDFQKTLMALNIKTIYSRNIWILMLYSAFHMLGMNVNYLGNVEGF